MNRKYNKGAGSNYSEGTGSPVASGAASPVRGASKSDPGSGAAYTGWRLRHLIDAFKGAALPICLFILYRFQQTDNPTMWTYCALHGSYGLLWCLKSHYFGDRAWEEPLSPAMFVKGSLLLGGYFMFPYIIASRSLQHGPAFFASVVFTYALGVFLHFSSDMQKHTTLSLLSRASLPPQLITTGLFTYTRNPNYLGELLIYSSFVALTGPHPLSVAYLLMVMVGLWLPNMRCKDASLSRYEGFEAYRSRTGLIFPTKLW